MTVFPSHLRQLAKNRSVSLEQFHQRYDHLNDGYKYEWNNGFVEKTKNMNQYQTTLFATLMRIYIRTQSFANGGILTNETDMMTTEKQLRRPDMAIYSGEQLALMKNNHNQVANWVAEVISDSDNINRVNYKLEEYFEAGIQVVWHIFPDIKTVYVYTAADQVVICKNNKICSGAPALLDFEISAAQLFT